VNRRCPTFSPRVPRIPQITVIGPRTDHRRSRDTRNAGRPINLAVRDDERYNTRTYFTGRRRRRRRAPRVRKLNASRPPESVDRVHFPYPIVRRLVNVAGVRGTIPALLFVISD